MTKPRVLVISPAFHGYWRSIERALQQDGYAVTTHCYDEFATFGAKARNKLRYELADKLKPGSGTQRFGSDATRDAVAVLRTVKPDVVLAVKCDVMESALWDAADEIGAATVVWLYDELRRTHFEPDGLSRFKAVASYSPHDVAALCNKSVNAHYVPLAFDPACAATPIASDEVVFIGARYPTREQTLVGLREARIPVRAYGRDWSHHTTDRLRTWSWHRPDIPAGPQLDRSESCARMAGAAATLNIHGDQDGFTMRTFEAAGVGALQLIDRADVDGLYEPGVELVPYTCVDEAIELCRRAQTDKPWARSVREAGQARTAAEHTFGHRMNTLAALWD